MISSEFHSYSFFKLIMHFELIFVYGLKYGSNLIFFVYTCLVVPEPLLKEYSYLTEFSQSKVVQHKCSGLFLGALPLIALMYTSNPMPVLYYYLDYCRFVINLAVGKQEFFKFVLFFKIVLAVLGPFNFPTNFRPVLPISVCMLHFPESYN